ncbi:hypothetical protein IQ264_25750 [Phormidium sp. LEGE 05292]|uniref:WD40 repeat domain-containing protein n=1 Tax=[Phormidium] sp. LEGE 05292 TaxID=767427 RepID=UPI00187E3606|nr:WD40 repeat domain-containing protein [Phormidium sp. LEGE 05292]MBE9228820.1 hypothetical protein [Phormidium sp. LEGE 05292]
MEKTMLEPYRGIPPYREEDSIFYFGRESWRNKVIKYLKLHKLTVLYGQSGVGKSSLLQAGVTSLLREEAENNRKIIGVPKLATIVFNEWEPTGDDLTYSDIEKQLLNRIQKKILEEIVQVTKDDSVQEKSEKIKAQKKQEAEEKENLLPSDWILDLMTYIEILSGKFQDGKLLIILDPFENYFLYNLSLKNEFLKFLSEAVNYCSLPVNFLISLRSDAYYQLEQLKSDIPSIFDHCLELNHLEKESARQAIIKPLNRYNCQQTIVNHLKKFRLTILVGGSKIGKSFILKKGVVPYLDSELKENLDKSEQSLFPTVILDDWKTESLNELIKNIETKIAPILEIKLSKSRSTDKLDNIFKAWSNFPKVKQSNSQLLIILDYFKEDGHHSTNQELFSTLLHQLLTSNDWSVHCLISLREDDLESFYTLISEFKDKIPAFDDQYFELSEDSICIKSFKDKNQQFSSQKTVEFEDNLVDNILKELCNKDKLLHSNNETSTEVRVAAPYLQIVMTRLWEEKECQNGLHIITKKKFDDAAKPDNLDFVDVIVKEYVEQKISQLFSKEGKSEKTKQDEKTAKHVLSYFLTPSGGKNLLSGDDLVKYAQEEADKFNLPWILKEEKVNEILKKLSDARILRSVGLSSKPSYEIYLSQLGKVIRQIRTEYLSYVRSLTIAQRLPAQALSLLKYKQDDLAALLTLHAYNKLKENGDVYSLSQVDSAIREILNKHRFSCLFEKPDYNESDIFQPTFWQAAFNPKMDMVAASQQRGELWLWDLSQSNLTTKSFQIYEDHNFRNREFLDLPIAFNPDGSLLASICQNNTEKKETVTIWEVDRLMSWDGQPPTPKAKFQLPSKGQIMSVAFQPPNGQIVATVSWQGHVTLWDLNKAEKPVLCRNIETKKENNWIWSVAFSADGNMIAIGGKYGVYLWELFTKSEFIARKTIIMNLCKDDPKEIFSVTFSQDGKWLAVGAGDRNVYLYHLYPLDKITQPPCPLKGHKDEVRAVAFSSDSTRLASASKDQTIRVWNLENLETDSPPETEEILSGHYYGVGSVAFDPQNSQRLISCGWDRTIRIWDLQTEPKIKEFFPENEKHEDIDVISVGFIDDKRFIVVISDNRVLVGDYKSLDQKTPLKDAADAKVSAVAFWPLNNPIEKVAIGSSDNQIEIWEWKEENLVRTFKYQETQNEDIKNISSLAFSPNGEILVLGLANAQNTVYLFDLTQSITELHPLKYTEPVSSMCFNSNPNQVILAISNKTGKISLWNLNQITKPCPLIEKPLEQKQIFGFSAPIVFNPDGESLASGTDHSLIDLWDLNQSEQSNFPELKPSENTKFLELQKSLPSQNFCVTSLAFSFTKDRKWLASGRYDGSIQLWDMNNLDCEPIVLQGHKSQVSSLAFSPDGKKLLSGSFDNTVCLWIVETEELVKKLKNNWRRELTEKEQKKFIGIESPR